jgi:hypothetical protein
MPRRPSVRSRRSTAASMPSISRRCGTHSAVSRRRTRRESST